MKLKYLQKLKPIFEKVGKRHNITSSEAEYILEKYFESLRDALYDPRIPRVLLPMIGVFRPKISYIDRSLKRSLFFYRNGGNTREYIKARFQRIWNIRRRLQQEKEGKFTWKEWKKKEVYELYRRLQENELQKKRESKEDIYGGFDNPDESKSVFSAVLRGLPEKGRKRRKP